MVDLETLGLDDDSIILSIGACYFTTEKVYEDDYQFYREISIPSAQDLGLEIDGETLQWWLGQDEQLLDILKNNEDAYEVTQALEEFVEYAEPADEVWAHSPKFDVAKLETALNKAGIQATWNHRTLRDSRTLEEVIDPNSLDDSSVDHPGRKHHALDDAVYQARWASSYLRELDQHNLLAE